MMSMETPRPVKRLPFFRQADSRFAERVLPCRDGADGVIVERVAGLCNLVYGFEHRVDRAVADGDVVQALARMAQGHAPRWN